MTQPQTPETNTKSKDSINQWAKEATNFWNQSEKNKIIIGLIVAGFLFLILLICVCYCCKRKRRKEKKHRKDDIELEDVRLKSKPKCQQQRQEKHQKRQSFKDGMKRLSFKEKTYEEFSNTFKNKIHSKKQLIKRPSRCQLKDNVIDEEDDFIPIQGVSEEELSPQRKNEYIKLGVKELEADLKKKRRNLMSQTVIVHPTKSLGYIDPETLRLFDEDNLH